MEANRFMSYPYEVLEEAVVNAFYHRDYMCFIGKIAYDRFQVTGR